MSTASMEAGQKWSRVLGWGWGARELGPQILILCSLSLETLSTVTNHVWKVFVRPASS